MNSNQEIDQWMKKTFGKGCSLGGQEATNQIGVVNLKIQGDGKGLGDTECPVNYAVFLRYSLSKHQLIYWVLGQAPSFLSNQNGDIVFDIDMLGSFHFEQ
jgi:hypothetical protein